MVEGRLSLDERGVPQPDSVSDVHMPPVRLAIFISGSGSNLQAILDAIDGGDLHAKIVLVVSNRRDAFGLVRAERAGIPTLYAPLQQYRHHPEPRATYEDALAQQVAAYTPDLLILVGWMHIFGAPFLNQFPQRVINLHPALPGMFPGVHAIDRAYEAYQQGDIAHSGCMTHYAIPEVDAGPVIDREIVPFIPGETLAQFEARMHQAEHRLVLRTLQRLIAERQPSSEFLS